MIQIKKSSFNISIGSGIAFEALMTATAPKYDESLIIDKFKNDYDCVWVNVFTILRNIISSIEDRNVDLNKHIKDLVILLAEDLSTINSIFNIELSDKKIYFYLPDYSKIIKELGENCRLYSSEKKSLEFNTMNTVCKRLNNDFNKKIMSINKRSIVLTHFPIDLLNINNNKEIYLLESNTGVIKSKREFSSKFYKIKDKDNVNKTDIFKHIPFNLLTILIFGDSHFFNTSSLKLRKFLIALSNEKKWNYLTSEEKIIRDVRLSKIDDELLQQFNKIKDLKISNI